MSRPARLTRRKRLLFAAFAVALPFVLLEAGFRCYFAYKVGPSVLLYAIRDSER